ncbi:VanZ family protein [Caldimonas brevitalea]|uniref:Transmembrane protein n=1 Tax=Caldimonas brevitalea TaxID=413882 RepID=A0A0G3BE73_9BURK|nr:VanZ family protein [Caldimonas brevitalea]AKJ27607.1 transmembrane protein [Caldimonas brevitalea]
MSRHRSSLVPLALAYAALVVYASLYPFSEWQAPGVSPWAFWTLPWPRWWTGFDLVSNLLGYMPLGGLWCGALMRTGWHRILALLVAVLLGAGLSAGLEMLQNFLPSRVPSNVDFALNTLGTLAGALLAVLVAALGWLGRWQTLRDRWFVPQSGGGLALLLLWPVALLFPAPVPLALGHVGERLHEALQDLLRDTPYEAWALDLPAPGRQPLTPELELATIAMGLLAPCLLAYTITPPTWRRSLLVLGAALLGAAATTLSTALGFGPDHAFAWVAVASEVGWLVGVAVALVLAFLPPRVAAALGLGLIATSMALVNLAPADPYFASSLQGWEQGRFIRFHGLAQWIGWLWPYVTLAYFAARLFSRGPQAPTQRQKRLPQRRKDKVRRPRIGA